MTLTNIAAFLVGMLPDFITNIAARNFLAGMFSGLLIGMLIWRRPVRVSMINENMGDS